MSSNDSDIEIILSHRYDNGADFWATKDGRIYVGNPFSTISSLGMLHELGLNENHEAVKGALELILSRSRDDGKIQLAPKAPLYQCYTAEAARVLCRFELHQDGKLEQTIKYFIENSHDSGGWRCNFTKLGTGPETKYANPGATLNVLDVLRFFPEFRHGSKVADLAVQSLLEHWETRKPIGPCHWGIGTLFTQVEFPFLRYNIFFYVYVLSFFKRARDDTRFKEAFRILNEKQDERGRLVIERPHRGLKELGFCAKNHPSEVATKRYQEINKNLA